MKEKITLKAFTVDEVAECLGVHRATVANMIESGTIRARRALKRWLIPASALEEYLAERDNPARVYTSHEVAGILGMHVNTVAKMFQEGIIRARRNGKNWIVPESALDEYLSGRDN